MLEIQTDFDQREQRCLVSFGDKVFNVNEMRKRPAAEHIRELAVMENCSANKKREQNKAKRTLS